MIISINGWVECDKSGSEKCFSLMVKGTGSWGDVMCGEQCLGIRKTISEIRELAEKRGVIINNYFLNY